MSEILPTEEPTAPKDGVAPELIEQLHQANEQFSRAKHHMDEAIDAEVNNLEERERASQEIGEAQGELNKVDELIEKELKKTER